MRQGSFSEGILHHDRKNISLGQGLDRKTYKKVNILSGKLNRAY